MTKNFGVRNDEVRKKAQKTAPASVAPRNVPKEEPKEETKPVVVPEKKTEKLQPVQTNVFFKINSTVIRLEEARKVDELAAYLQKHPALKASLRRRFPAFS